jgi:hypothetical protein
LASAYSPADPIARSATSMRAATSWKVPGVSREEILSLTPETTAICVALPAFVM